MGLIAHAFTMSRAVVGSAGVKHSVAMNLPQGCYGKARMEKS
jgi:hypothetical protein